MHKSRPESWIAPAARAAVMMEAVGGTYRAGSDSDFDRLYRDTYARLLGSMTAVLSDRAAAEDCVQEAFVRAYRAWSGWRPHAPPEAWLHRIALNVALNHRARERLREAAEVIRRLGRPAPAPDPSDMVSNDLFTALSRLPPKLVAAIVLRHQHGYTNREIAIALGIPERTVASRLAAAKERLRRELGPEWRPAPGRLEPRPVPSADG